jgi:hypothetical protein
VAGESSDCIDILHFCCVDDGCTPCCSNKCMEWFLGIRVSTYMICMLHYCYSLSFLLWSGALQVDYTHSMMVWNYPLCPQSWQACFQINTNDTLQCSNTFFGTSKFLNTDLLLHAQNSTVLNIK